MIIAAFYIFLALFPFLVSGGHFINHWYVIPLLILNGFIQGAVASYKMFSVRALLSRLNWDGSSTNDHYE